MEYKFSRENDREIIKFSDNMGHSTSFVPQMTIISVISTSNNIMISIIYARNRWRTSA